MTVYQAILTIEVVVEATTAENIVDNIAECKQVISDALSEWGDTSMTEFKLTPPEEWKQP